MLFQEGRSKIFQDFVECKRDTMQVQARFESRLEETQRTQIRYEFRNEQWLIKHHGDRKAEKIMQRKKELGLILDSLISFSLFCQVVIIYTGSFAYLTGLHLRLNEL